MSEPPAGEQHWCNREPEQDDDVRAGDPARFWKVREPQRIVGKMNDRSNERGNYEHVQASNCCVHAANGRSTRRRLTPEFSCKRIR